MGGCVLSADVLMKLAGLGRERERERERGKYYKDATNLYR